MLFFCVAWCVCSLSFQTHRRHPPPPHIHTHTHTKNQKPPKLGVVDVCLIPEVSFRMDKLLAHVGQLLDTKGHAVVCVAEGAGQDLMSGANGGAPTDASGNAILRDVGMHLRDAFKAHFKGEADVKYIDPSYIIRSIPTTTNDRIYCKVLGQGAVHGAFAGEDFFF